MWHFARRTITLMTVATPLFGHAQTLAPIASGASRAPVALDAQTDSINEFYLRYGLHDLFGKLVDDKGRGYEDLYGVRNFRMVLTGLVYRGGANNAYNRNGRRANSNPLPDEGLRHLCEEGFDQAVYLYPTRFASAPVKTSCRTRHGDENTLTYFQHSPLASPRAARAILKLLHDKIIDPTSRHPIFLHCWNGWHASGYISALVLRQFCQMPVTEAVDYWNRNTDGNDKSASHEKIRNMIRSFQPDVTLGIPEPLREQVCQNM